MLYGFVDLRGELLKWQKEPFMGTWEQAKNIHFKIDGLQIQIRERRELKFVFGGPGLETLYWTELNLGHLTESWLALDITRAAAQRVKLGLLPI